MAVDPSLDELLKRLASSERLPATQQPFRTQQAQQGARLRDTALGVFNTTPRLSDAVQQIRQGGSAQTGVQGALAKVVGSPLARVALGGLNIIDMPRRAVISTLKEVNDYIDIDPNTKASFKDLREQFSDPSFGFGRVMPGKGWGGRIVGLIGDIALDPTTYLTLGGTVPLKAVAMGTRSAEAAGIALRAGARVGAEDVALRAALGTKNITGREGRFVLANIVKQYGGTAEEVAKVASHGKSAVPDDIAKVIGLQRNGLYMFGSRVRVPFTGQIGKALEYGLVKTRLGITNMSIGKKLQYLYTPKGATRRLGDLSTIRADMASGRIAPQTVDLIMTQLNGVENARRLGASVGADTANDARMVVSAADVNTYRGEVASFVENGKEEFLSPSQVTAKRSVEDFFKRAADTIEGLMRRVDPEWTMPRTPNYVPHVLSDKARLWMEANLDDAWVRRLEQYMTSDVLDLKNNMAGRYLKPGMNFLDSPKHVLQTGSISEINGFFRDLTGKNFDLFETDIARIMGKYVDTVRSAGEISALLSDLKSNDFIRLLRTQGEVDPEYVTALRAMVQGQFDDAGKLNQKLRGTMSAIVDEVDKQFSRDFRSSAASKLAATVPDIRGEITAANRQIAAGEKAQELLDGLLKQVDDLIAKEQTTMASLASSFEDQSIVFELMKDSYDKTVASARDLAGRVQEMRARLANAGIEAAELRTFHEELKTKAVAAQKQFEEAQRLTDFYREYGDSVAPALQDIYEKIRETVVDGDLSDVAYVGDELWKAERTEQVNSVLEILMKPFDVKVYPSSTSLGEEWTKNTLQGNNESGRLLRTIADIGGRGTKAQRVSMGRVGSRRAITMDDARAIVARSTWVGDNPEDVGDAFSFLTMRELRAAYDSVGGGDAGIAAQNAVARELLAGETARSKLWLEARDAADRVMQSKKVLDDVGSRRQQLGGKYATSVLETIERVESELEAARKIQNIEVSDSLLKVGSTFDGLKKDFTKEKRELFLQNASSFLDLMRSQKDGLITDPNWRGLDLAIQKFSQNMADGVDVTITEMRTFFDNLEEFATVEFSNTPKVRKLSQQLEQLKKSSARALAMEKRFDDGVTALADSVVDSGAKLSNYMLWHTARIAGDAIQKLGPAGMEIGDTMWGYALSGAARQQLQSALDFRNTRTIAERAMREVQEKVYSAKVGERAQILQDAMNELSPEDYAAVSATIGNVSFVEQGRLASLRLPHWRRNTAEYVNVRDEILSLKFPGWDTAEDRVVGGKWATKASARIGSPVRLDPETGAVMSDVEQAVLGAEARGESIAEVAARFEAPKFTETEGTLPDIDLMRAKDYSRGENYPAAAATRANRTSSTANSWDAQVALAASGEGTTTRRSLLDATPKMLNEYINELRRANLIDKQRAESLRLRVKNGEMFAKDQRKRAIQNFDEELLGTEKRALGREVQGAKRAESEAFGLAGAFSKAIATREDGGTLSPRRIDEFFTYVFGDGKVRLATGDSSSGAPVRRGLSVAEEQHARDVKFLFARERVKKEARRREGWDSVENELQFWRDIANSEQFSKTGISKVVDYPRVQRIVLEKQSTNRTIADLKKILKGMQAEEQVGKIPIAETADGVYTVDALKVRIGSLQQRVRSLDKDLRDMETAAGQLIPLGSASENAYRTISVADSQFGKIDNRLERRIAALSELAIDPTAPEQMSDLSLGLGRKPNYVIGRFGKLERLKSQLNELDAAIEATQKAEKAVVKKGEKIGRAAAKRQENVKLADAIRSNPALDAKIGEVLNSQEPLTTRKWLDATQLGGTAENPIPKQVSELINEAHRLRLKMQKMEADPMYTRALQRKQEDDFFKLFARLNLEPDSLEFPSIAYTNETFGDLRRFASSGLGASLGLNPGSLEVREATELIYNDVAGKLVADTGGKEYAVVVDGRRATRQAVVDSVKMRENRKFTYTAALNKRDDGSVFVNLTDKSTGAQFEFRPEDFGIDPRTKDAIPDIELSEPVYMRNASSREQQDFIDLMDPKKPNTVYKLGEVLNAGESKMYDPNNSIVTFASADNSQRVFKMNELGIKQRTSRALDPAVVFDPAAGRGLSKDSFEALFAEPLQPGSKKARKMRANIDEQVTRRDELYRQYNDARKKMRAAKTEKERRAHQGLAASIEEDMRTMDEAILALEEKYRSSLPARHMESVQMAMNVLEYFKEPTVHLQLGLKVDRYPIGVDPVTGQIQYKFAEITDKQAKSAFNTYLEALEYGKVKKYLKREKVKVEGTERTKSVVTDTKQPLVSPNKRAQRLGYLRRQWEKSPEKAILSEYNSYKMRDAAIAKTLHEMREGGPDAVLIAERDAAIRERDLLLAEMGIAENNVRKAMRGEEGAPQPVIEGMGAVEGAQLTGKQAREFAVQREKMLSEELASDVMNAIPPELKAAAAEELRSAGTSNRMRMWLRDASLVNLNAATAVETVLKRELDVLAKEESRINTALAGMIKIRMGESVQRNVRNVIPAEYKELQLRLNGSTRYGVKGIKQEIAEKQAQLAEIANKRRALEAQVIQTRTAVDGAATANMSKKKAEARLALTRDTLEDMRGMRARAKKPKPVKPVAKTGKKALKAEGWQPVRPKDTNWTAEYDDFVSELDDLIGRVSKMPDGPDTDKLAGLIVDYTEGKAALLRSLAIAGEGEAQIPAMLAMGPQVYKKVLEDGWVKLSGSGSLSNFKNLQMRPEVDEILKNMNRLIEPPMVAELNRFLGRYTRFFKSWALATPGYHSRNAITNGFMMFAAGGRPKFLYEGMMEYNALHKALTSGMPFEAYVNKLPIERQAYVRRAYDAMLGSGVGQTAEIGLDSAGVLTNNPWTRANRRVGVWTESHSRFMLAYDGIRQGLDVNGATARVRKFLFDYEDISTLDMTMRSIIPFWMWSSRILPLTIQNIYMNPRPYQWYQSVRRNIEDQEATKGLPLYMREAGAFALPGTSLAATPDLGFNRTQADVAAFTQPLKFAANVNPALRVPIELLAGKSFFRNREFAETPTEVSGPVGRLASILGTPIGKGQTQGGKQYVNEDMLYAVTNALPMLNQIERFIPSQEYYQQRGSTNPLLGYIGAPVREVTPQMRTSEQKRILSEIQKLLRNQPKPQEG